MVVTEAKLVFAVLVRIKDGVRKRIEKTIKKRQKTVKFTKVYE